MRDRMPYTFVLGARSARTMNWSSSAHPNPNVLFVYFREEAHTDRVVDYVVYNQRTRSINFGLLFTKMSADGLSSDTGYMRVA